VYYCIDQPTSPYKGVRGKAKVRVSEDVSYDMPIYEKMMLKYFGDLEQPGSHFLLMLLYLLFCMIFIAGI